MSLSPAVKDHEATCWAWKGSGISTLDIRNLIQGLVESTTPHGRRLGNLAEPFVPRRLAWLSKASPGTGTGTVPWTRSSPYSRGPNPSAPTGENQPSSEALTLTLCMAWWHVIFVQWCHQRPMRIMRRERWDDLETFSSIERSRGRRWHQHPWLLYHPTRQARSLWASFMLAPFSNKSTNIHPSKLKTIKDWHWYASSEKSTIYSMHLNLKMPGVTKPLKAGYYH